jgi:UDP-N-acetylmuramoylalanine--D-glutamate ligase
VTLTTGPLRAEAFAGVDEIAISPGLDRREPVVAEVARRGVPVVGDIDYFARALSGVYAATRLPEVLAITGSNGKSTVTAMAGELARAGGRRTAVAGNIGLPVLDALSEAQAGGMLPDTFVLELSSFQLESTYHLRPGAATVLNISEDHLDRYAGLVEYAAAKARIFDGGGAQVLNRDDRLSMGMVRPGYAVHTFGLKEPRRETDWGVRPAGGRGFLAHGGRVLMPVEDIPLAGMHNVANALAALALVHVLRLPEPPLDALRRFQGLPHRVQKVGEKDGVVFYDDSKGTNVGATVAALSGLGTSAVLIAGGDGKGQDFTPLAAPVAAHARAVVLIGRDAEAMAGVLAGTGVPVLRAQSLEEAVNTAFEAAREGDAVLLSPACASFDMFRNYVHRAEVFVQAVRALEGGAS